MIHDIAEWSNFPKRHLETRPLSQVCVKENTNIEADSDISLEIPPGTVIAYSICELEIRKNGQFGEHISITGVREKRGESAALGFKRLTLKIEGGQLLLPDNAR